MLLAAVAVSMLAVSSGCSGLAPGKDAAVKYQVARVSRPITIDAQWDKPAWKKIKAIELTNHMGDKPAHFPKVQAKIGYDPANIYVIWRVEDNYVRAVAAKHQGPVCRDSCVEFFFTPGADTTRGYFNLEMNCGGTMLLNYQTIPWQNVVELTAEELAKVEVAHVMSKIVEPEIAKPTVWTVEYRFPIELLAKYMPSAVKPAPGVQWRVNLYKCADATSHPHWLTWAKVDRPRPDFHQPEYFGEVKFK
jgi:hypothetical protein